VSVRLRVTALSILVTAPAVAQADRFEASLGGALQVGLARVGERGADATTVPAFGVGARFTHAWSNALAWDLAVSALVTQPATFDDAAVEIDGREVRGALTRRTLAADAQVGAELRLGARVIPTLRLGLGPQVRYRTGSNLGMLADVVPSTVTIDAVASLGVGLDIRLGRSRVVGVVAQLDHAQPLGDGEPHDVVALTLRFSSYWYPRWWSPSW